MQPTRPLSRPQADGGLSGPVRVVPAVGRAGCDAMLSGASGCARRLAGRAGRSWTRIRLGGERRGRRRGPGSRVAAIPWARKLEVVQADGLRAAGAENKTTEQTRRVSQCKMLSQGSNKRLHLKPLSLLGSAS